MLRKGVLFSVAILLVFAMATVASADPYNTMHVSQKGSMLVFPKYINYPDDNVTTYIFIGNDNKVGTDVVCYWMTKEQKTDDIHFYITKDMPLTIASNDGPFSAREKTVGALMCYAAFDSTGIPNKFNHLYGYAMIVSDAGHVIYNANAFQYKGTPAQAQAILDGKLKLDGDFNYEACANYLVTTFIPDGLAWPPDAVENIQKTYHPELVLLPCINEWQQGNGPTRTKANYEVWDYNEQKLSGADQCIKCWFEGFLVNSTNGGVKFTADRLSEQLGRLRVRGIKNEVVCPGSIATGLIGLLLYSEDDPATATDPVKPFAAQEMINVNFNTTGQFTVDAPSGPLEAPKN